MRRAASGITKTLHRSTVSSVRPSSAPNALIRQCFYSVLARPSSTVPASPYSSNARRGSCGRDDALESRRRHMSSDSMADGSEPPKSKYMEKEAIIREAQQAVRDFYKEGAYQDALDVTQRLVDLVDDLFGRNHAVYASALNDQALMLKSVGRLTDATDTYLKALEIYRVAYKGEENVSFAATLHNLGMTFRTMAEQSNTLEKMPLLERTQESFQRCLEIREKILPNNHPDLQLVKSRLAMVQNLLGGEKERTEARLRAALDGLMVGVGAENASTATAMTNLALFLKGEDKYDEAQELYTTVMYARRKVLGPTHVDTIVAMFNLAELHRAAGREEAAIKIQDEIVTIGEKVEAGRAQASAEAEAAARSASGDSGDNGEAEGESGRGSVEAGHEDEGNVSATWTPGGTKKAK